MSNYMIHWTPANLAEDGRAQVCVSWLEHRDAQPQTLFVDYENTTYGQRGDLEQIMRRVLSYHMNRDPDIQTVRRFLARPTVSPAIVTEAELNDFFGEDEHQRGLRV